MISEVDLRDWERAEDIIDSLKVAHEQHFEDGVLTFDDYRFLSGLIQRQLTKFPQIPALFKPIEQNDMPY